MEIYREVIDAVISLLVLGGLVGLVYVGFSVVVDIFEWLWPF